MQLARRFVLALSLAALSTTALADGHGPGPGGPGGGPGDGPGGGHVVVASDGKALVAERIAAASSTATATYRLRAISTSGAVAWTYAAPSEIHEVVALPNLVIVSLGGDRSSTTTAVTTTLVALNLSSGSTAWTATLDGGASGIEAASNGILLTVTKVTAGSGTTAATVTRTLQLISLAGSVVWTLPLGV